MPEGDINSSFLQAYSDFLGLQGLQGKELSPDATTDTPYRSFRLVDRRSLGCSLPPVFGKYYRLTLNGKTFPSLQEVHDNLGQSPQDAMWLHGENPNEISGQSKLSNRLDLALYMIKTMAPECVRLSSIADSDFNEAKKSELKTAVHIVNASLSEIGVICDSRDEISSENLSTYLKDLDRAFGSLKFLDDNSALDDEAHSDTDSDGEDEFFDAAEEEFSDPKEEFSDPKDVFSDVRRDVENHLRIQRQRLIGAGIFEGGLRLKDRSFEKIQNRIFRDTLDSEERKIYQAVEDYSIFTEKEKPDLKKCQSLQKKIHELKPKTDKLKDAEEKINKVLLDYKAKELLVDDALYSTYKNAVDNFSEETVSDSEMEALLQKIDEISNARSPDTAVDRDDTDLYNSDKFKKDAIDRIKDELKENWFYYNKSSLLDIFLKEMLGEDIDLDSPSPLQSDLLVKLQTIIDVMHVDGSVDEDVDEDVDEYEDEDAIALGVDDFLALSGTPLDERLGFLEKKEVLDKFKPLVAKYLDKLNSFIDDSYNKEIREKLEGKDGDREQLKGDFSKLSGIGDNEALEQLEDLMKEVDLSSKSPDIDLDFGCNFDEDEDVVGLNELSKDQQKLARCLASEAKQCFSEAIKQDNRNHYVAYMNKFNRLLRISAVRQILDDEGWYQKEFMGEFNSVHRDFDSGWEAGSFDDSRKTSFTKGKPMSIENSSMFKMFFLDDYLKTADRDKFYEFLDREKKEKYEAFKEKNFRNLKDELSKEADQTELVCLEGFESQLSSQDIKGLLERVPEELASVSSSIGDKTLSQEGKMLLKNRELDLAKDIKSLKALKTRIQKISGDSVRDSEKIKLIDDIRECRREILRKNNLLVCNLLKTFLKTSDKDKAIATEIDDFISKHSLETLYDMDRGRQFKTVLTSPEVIQVMMKGAEALHGPMLDHMNPPTPGDLGSSALVPSLNTASSPSGVVGFGHGLLPSVSAASAAYRQNVVPTSASKPVFAPKPAPEPAPEPASALTSVVGRIAHAAEYVDAQLRFPGADAAHLPEELTQEQKEEQEILRNASGADADEEEERSSDQVEGGRPGILSKVRESLRNKGLSRSRARIEMGKRLKGVIKGDQRGSELEEPQDGAVIEQTDIINQYNSDVTRYNTQVEILQSKFPKENASMEELTKYQEEVESLEYPQEPEGVSGLESPPVFLSTVGQRIKVLNAKTDVQDKERAVSAQIKKCNEVSSPQTVEELRELKEGLEQTIQDYEDSFESSKEILGEGADLNILIESRDAIQVEANTAIDRLKGELRQRAEFAEETSKEVTRLVSDVHSNVTTMSAENIPIAIDDIILAVRKAEGAATATGQSFNSGAADRQIKSLEAEQVRRAAVTKRASTTLNDVVVRVTDEALQGNATELNALEAELNTAVQGYEAAAKNNGTIANKAVKKEIAAGKGKIVKVQAARTRLETAVKKKQDKLKSVVKSVTDKALQGNATELNALEKALRTAVQGCEAAAEKAGYPKIDVKDVNDALDLIRKEQENRVRTLKIKTEELNGCVASIPEDFSSMTASGLGLSKDAIIQAVLNAKAAATAAGQDIDETDPVITAAHAKIEALGAEEVRRAKEATTSSAALSTSLSQTENLEGQSADDLTATGASLSSTLEAAKRAATDAGKPLDQELLDKAEAARARIEEAVTRQTGLEAAATKSSSALSASLSQTENLEGQSSDKLTNKLATAKRTLEEAQVTATAAGKPLDMKLVDKANATIQSIDSQLKTQKGLEAAATLSARELQDTVDRVNRVGEMSAKVLLESKDVIIQGVIKAKAAATAAGQDIDETDPVITAAHAKIEALGAEEVRRAKEATTSSAALQDTVSSVKDVGEMSFEDIKSKQETLVIQSQKAQNAALIAGREFNSKEKVTQAQALLQRELNNREDTVAQANQNLSEQVAKASPEQLATMNSIELTAVIEGIESAKSARDVARSRLGEEPSEDKEVGDALDQVREEQGNRVRTLEIKTGELNTKVAAVGETLSNEKHGDLIRMSAEIEEALNAAEAAYTAAGQEIDKNDPVITAAKDKIKAIDGEQALRSA
ncbi:MAG: hypothetical protein VX737_02925, partial [Pseudomonadota bacterium]|nr:hypothetical protein [Pseudomonadota bacterium]